MPDSARHEIAAGIRQSLPAGLGMFPLGMAFGMLVVQAGLPWWVAPALSFGIYAGSVELLMVGLLSSGASLVAVAATTLLVNFRHVLYPFSFPLRAVKGRLAKAYSVYAMTDEAYAITAADPGSWTGRRLLTVQVAFQCYWVTGGLVGVAVAGILPMRIEGLEFALCALFVTLTLDAWKNHRELPALLIAAASTGVAVLVTPDAVIFTGLSIFAVALLVRYLLARSGRGRLEEATDA